MECVSKQKWDRKHIYEKFYFAEKEERRKTFLTYFYQTFSSDDLGGSNPADVDTWLQVNDSDDDYDDIALLSGPT